jgi:hypothetical protein
MLGIYTAHPWRLTFDLKRKHGFSDPTESLWCNVQSHLRSLDLQMRCFQACAKSNDTLANGKKNTPSNLFMLTLCILRASWAHYSSWSVRDIPFDETLFDCR